jgi:catechol 2,3-dioxygenase-like lactoylglutathione lyase family enzyme
MSLSEFPCYTILLSKDLDASREFYHGVLGLEIMREDLGPDVEPRIVFKTANGRLILSKSTVGTSDTQTQMAWMVPDIHAAVAELRARGVKIEDYEEPAPVTVDDVADMGYSWAAWFIDPSANCLAIVQPKG